MISQNYKFSLILLVLSLFAGSVNAQNEEEPDSVVRAYRWNEEWYAQGLLGVNYLAAEHTQFKTFGDIAKFEFGFALGKRFSPIWGTRLQLQFGSDTGSYYGHQPDGPTFDFSHTNLSLIATFNVLEAIYLRKNREYNRRWNLNAMLGIGSVWTNFNRTNDTEKLLDLTNSVYFTVYAGLDLTYSISKYVDVMLELSSHWQSKHFNGMIIERENWFKKIDQRITMLAGVRYTIYKPRRRFKPYRSKKETPVVQEYFVPMIGADKVHGTHFSAPDENECYSLDELVGMTRQHKSILGKRLCYDDDIYFDHGRSDMRIVNHLYLDKVIELMNTQNVMIVLKAANDAHSGRALSETRIDGIEAYLMGNGIAKERIRVEYVPAGTERIGYDNVRLEFLPLERPLSRDYAN
ncbi:MAG: hypothetical protein HUK08_04420 [Bacteroidaceae bacterium]|nr:hypothetical protein [Bacteroidaceae bacterium]